MILFIVARYQIDKMCKEDGTKIAQSVKSNGDRHKAISSWRVMPLCLRWVSINFSCCLPFIIKGGAYDESQKMF
jgi:hypothetical protein